MVPLEDSFVVYIQVYNGVVEVGYHVKVLGKNVFIEVFVHDEVQVGGIYNVNYHCVFHEDLDNKMIISKDNVKHFNYNRVFNRSFNNFQKVEKNYSILNEG